MGFKLSAGLGLALVILAGSFKMYYDKTQAEIEAFHLQLDMKYFTAVCMTPIP